MVCMQQKQRVHLCRPPLPVLFAFLLSTVPLGAQARISNPSLPPEEDFLYSEKVQDQSWTVTQKLVLISENGVAWYEFTSQSPESDVTMRLDPETLIATRSEVTTRSGDSVIRRTTEILEATPHPKPGELMVGDYSSLPVTLRGIPWGAFTSVNIVALGAARGAQQVSVQLTIVGRESISAGGKTYDCWKVQLGLGGFLGAFLGKSSYWFAAAAPYILVKSEGPTGGPGSPMRVMELLRYSAPGR
jgi:hypothetical protein